MANNPSLGTNGTLWFVAMVVIGIIGIIGLVDRPLLKRFHSLWVLPAILGMLLSAWYMLRSIPSMLTQNKR